MGLPEATYPGPPWHSTVYLCDGSDAWYWSSGGYKHAYTGKVDNQEVSYSWNMQDQT